MVISWTCIRQIYQTPLQEYFFVPYTFTDVNDEREIHKGDEVSFYMAKNKRSVHGALYYFTQLILLVITNSLDIHVAVLISSAY